MPKKICGTRGSYSGGIGRYNPEDREYRMDMGYGGQFYQKYVKSHKRRPKYFFETMEKKEIAETNQEKTDKNEEIAKKQDQTTNNTTETTTQTQNKTRKNEKTAEKEQKTKNAEKTDQQTDQQTHQEEETKTKRQTPAQSGPFSLPLEEGTGEWSNQGTKEINNEHSITPPTVTKAKETLMTLDVDTPVFQLINRYESLSSDSDDEDGLEEEEDTAQEPMEENSVEMEDTEEQIMKDDKKMENAMDTTINTNLSEHTKKADDNDTEVQIQDSQELTTEEETKTEQQLTDTTSPTYQSTNGTKRRTLTDAEQRQPPSKLARSQQPS